MFDRFPKSHSKIILLLKEDVDFQEMCADYEELANWIDANCQEDRRPETECAEAGHVLESLESDIIRKISSALGEDQMHSKAPPG